MAGMTRISRPRFRSEREDAFAIVRLRLCVPDTKTSFGKPKRHRSRQALSCVVGAQRILSATSPGISPVPLRSVARYGDGGVADARARRMHGREVPQIRAAWWPTHGVRLRDDVGTRPRRSAQRHRRTDGHGARPHTRQALSRLHVIPRDATKHSMCRCHGRGRAAPHDRALDGRGVCCLSGKRR